MGDLFLLRPCLVSGKVCDTTRITSIADPDLIALLAPMAEAWQADYSDHISAALGTGNRNTRFLLGICSFE